MAWENRKGRGRYYTRSRRINGRIVRQYVGRGRRGELAAAADDQRRADIRAMNEALRTDRQHWQIAENPLDQMDELATLLMHAALYAAGFHLHARSEWRRGRESGG